jgi:hypothetical protein
MKSLEERLTSVREAYERDCQKELLLELDLKYLEPVLTIDDCWYGSSYIRYSFLYYTMDLRKFEDTIMEPLSKQLGINWLRMVKEDEITYSTIVIRDGRSIHLTFYAKPSNGCRIIRRFTGTTHKESKTMEVDVPDVEYMVDCSESPEAKGIIPAEEMVSNNPPDSSEVVNPTDDLGDLV